MSDDTPREDRLMTELQGIRTAVARIGDQVRDHDQQLREIRPLVDGYRSLIDCNSQIVRELQGIREDQRRGVAEISSRVEASLRGDILALRRDLRTEMAALSKRVEASSCAAAGHAPAGPEPPVSGE